MNLSDEQKGMLRKVICLRYTNIAFMLLAVVALVFEVIIFSFESWVVDSFLIVETVFITMNLGFILLHEDA